MADTEIDDFTLLEREEDVEKRILDALGGNFTPVIIPSDQSGHYLLSGQRGYYLKHNAPGYETDNFVRATFFVPDHLNTMKSKNGTWACLIYHDDKWFKSLGCWLSTTRAADFHLFLVALWSMKKEDVGDMERNMFSPEVLEEVKRWATNTL